MSGLRVLDVEGLGYEAALVDMDDGEALLFVDAGLAHDDRHGGPQPRDGPDSRVSADGIRTIPDIECPQWCSEGATHLLHYTSSGEVWHAHRLSNKVSIDQFAVGEGAPMDLPPRVIVLDLSDELTADEAREVGQAMIAAAELLDEITGCTS